MSCGDLRIMWELCVVYMSSGDVNEHVDRSIDGGYGVDKKHLEDRMLL